MANQIRSVPAKNYRYRGPDSFRDDETDSLIFFGRDEEVVEVLNRLLSSKLLVLYAKSGLGKTSLLQAGLFPKLRELNYLPIRLRFNLGKPLLEELNNAVAKTCQDQQIAYSPGQGESYWEFFNTAVFSKGDSFLTPVLILDQFEEVFTLRDEAYRQQLAQQLGHLVSGQVPEAVRERIRCGDKPDYAATPPDIRLLISLREDSVGALQELVGFIPGILSQRFRLTQLDRVRAEKAIVNPANLNAPERFIAAAFDYPPETVAAILDYLQDKHGNIEPFQLQLLCQHIELKVIANQAGAEQTISVDLQTYLGGKDGMDAVIKGFYQNAIAQLPNWLTRRKVRTLCETGLLNSEGRRESLSKGQVKQRYRVNEKALLQLVESKVLRREERLDSYAYELSHDSLALAVFKSRKAGLKRKWLLSTLAVTLLFGTAFIWQWQQTQHADIQASTNLDEYKQQVKALVELDDPKGKRTIKEPKMQPLPKDTFMMGSSNTKNPEETPQHPVTVTAFAIGVYETTFEEYDQFAASEPEHQLPDDRGWGRGRRPVINVSWQDATDYAAWLSKKTGKDYHLPTEAQWEYAARGGSKEDYFWGNQDAKGYAWFSDNSDSKTIPVDDPRFKPNNFGLYHMAGNVWEWTEDCWHKNYQFAPKDGKKAWNAENGGDCSRRVLRGGSWYFLLDFLRSAFRFRYFPVNRYYDIGFRLAQD